MSPVMAGPPTPLRGLVPVEPFVQLDHPCSPAELVDEMLDAALAAKDAATIQRKAWDQVPGIVLPYWNAQDTPQ